jgi:hypothetical protein
MSFPDAWNAVTFVLPEKANQRLSTTQAQQNLFVAKSSLYCPVLIRTCADFARATQARGIIRLNLKYFFSEDAMVEALCARLFILCTPCSP